MDKLVVGGVGAGVMMPVWSGVLGPVSCVGTVVAMPALNGVDVLLSCVNAGVAMPVLTGVDILLVSFAGADGFGFLVRRGFCESCILVIQADESG
jgi:hypothetical protein